MCLEIKDFSKHFSHHVYIIHFYKLYMIRIMILDVKKYHILCLEFEHLFLDFKGIYKHDARGCLKVFKL